MPTEIETTGEAVTEETAKPKFSVDKALEWLRDPANEPKIRATADRVNHAIQDTVRRVDKSVSETAGVIKDALEDESVATEILDDLLTKLGFKPER